MHKWRGISADWQAKGAAVRLSKRSVMTSETKQSSYSSRSDDVSDSSDQEDEGPTEFPSNLFMKSEPQQQQQRARDADEPIPSGITNKDEKWRNGQDTGEKSGQKPKRPTRTRSGSPSPLPPPPNNGQGRSSTQHEEKHSSGPKKAQRETLDKSKKRRQRSTSSHVEKNREKSRSRNSSFSGSLGNLISMQEQTKRKGPKRDGTKEARQSTRRNSKQSMSQSTRNHHHKSFRSLDDANKQSYKSAPITGRNFHNGMSNSLNHHNPSTTTSQGRSIHEDSIPTPKRRGSKKPTTSLEFSDEAVCRAGRLGDHFSGSDDASARRRPSRTNRSMMGRSRSSLSSRRSVGGASRSSLGSRRSLGGASRSSLGSRRSLMSGTRSSLSARRQPPGRRHSRLIRENNSNNLQSLYSSMPSINMDANTTGSRSTTGVGQGRRDFNASMPDRLDYQHSRRGSGARRRTSQRQLGPRRPGGKEASIALKKTDREALLEIMAPEKAYDLYFPELGYFDWKKWRRGERRKQRSRSTRRRRPSADRVLPGEMDRSGLGRDKMVRRRSSARRVDPDVPAQQPQQANLREKPRGPITERATTGKAPITAQDPVVYDFARFDEQKVLEATQFITEKLRTSKQESTGEANMLGGLGNQKNSQSSGPDAGQLEKPIKEKGPILKSRKKQIAAISKIGKEKNLGITVATRPSLLVRQDSAAKELDKLATFMTSIDVLSNQEVLQQDPEPEQETQGASCCVIL